YRRQGHAVEARSILLVSLGFLVGSYGGARLAGKIAEGPLRWMFVGYLLALVLVIVLRARRRSDDLDETTRVSRTTSGWALTVIGACGGLSSGLLGIGGGAAMAAIMVGWPARPPPHPPALRLCATVGPA